MVKREGTIPWNEIGTGIRNVVVAIVEREGERINQEVEGYMAAGKVFHLVLCLPEVQVGATVGDAALAIGAAKLARDTRAALVASGYTEIAIAITWIACQFIPDSDSNRDSASDDDGGSPSVPSWAFSSIPHAPLIECTNHAGARGCGYDPDSEAWYVDSRRTNEPQTGVDPRDPPGSRPKTGWRPVTGGAGTKEGA